MGTTLLGQKSMSASIEQTIDGNYKQNGTYTRVYIVEADDECNDEYSVLFGTAGLPGINERSEIYPALRVSSRSAAEIAPRFWEVTIVWTLPEPPQIGGGGGGGGGGKKVGVDHGMGPATPVRDQSPPPGYDKTSDRTDPAAAPIDLPPWNRPARVTYTTAKKKVACTHAYYFGTSEDGMPSSTIPTEFPWTTDSNKFYPYGSGESGEIAMISFTNSAGDPYKYDIDRIVFQATHESSKLAPDFGHYVKHLNSVNGLTFSLDGGVNTFPPLTVLMSDFSASEEYWTDPETGENLGYWNVRVTYEIDFQTHIIPIMDMGTRCFTYDEFGNNLGINDNSPAVLRRPAGIADKNATYFRNNDQEIYEGALNGLGGPDKNGQPNHLYYLPYKIGAW